MYQKEFSARFKDEVLNYCIDMDKTLSENKFFNKRVRINELIELIYTVILKYTDFQLFVDAQQKNYVAKFSSNHPQKQVQADKSKLSPLSSYVELQKQRNANYSLESSENGSSMTKQCFILIKQLIKQEDVSKQVHESKIRLSKLTNDINRALLTFQGLESQEKELLQRKRQCNQELFDANEKITALKAESTLLEEKSVQTLQEQKNLLKNLQKQQKINNQRFSDEMDAAAAAGRRTLLERSGDVSRESALHETLCTQLSAELAGYKEQIAQLKAQGIQLQAKLQLIQSTNQQAVTMLEKNYKNWIIKMQEDLQNSKDNQIILKKQLTNAHYEFYEVKKAKAEAEIKDLEKQQEQTLNNYISDLKTEIIISKQTSVQLRKENKLLREQLAEQEEERKQLLTKEHEQSQFNDGDKKAVRDATLKIIHELRTEIAALKQKLPTEAKITRSQRSLVKSHLAYSRIQEPEFDIDEELQNIQTSIVQENFKKNTLKGIDVVNIMQQRKNDNMNKLIYENVLREKQQLKELNQKNAFLQRKTMQTIERPKVSDNIKEGKKLLRITKRNSSINLLLNSRK